MSGESSKRSSLIDITYQYIHTHLSSGQFDSTLQAQITETLRHRIPHLQNFSRPFGSPSSESRKKIESSSSSVALRDGVILRVEETDRPYIFAISEEFDIDEVEALVLFRSFLYNEGLPPDAGEGKEDVDSMVQDLVAAITPFYQSERLNCLRVLIPLFRSWAAGDEDPVNQIAREVLPEITQKQVQSYTTKIIDEYVRKTKEPIPAKLDSLPKKAAQWVKCNAREQLVLLEVLFWVMWDAAKCTGPTVVRILEAAYQTNLGSIQQNGNFLLEDEGLQLQEDSAALWILITIEILELEKVAAPPGDKGGMELPTDDKSVYWSSPESLQRIHELVLSNDGGQFACTYLAWAFVLSRIVAAVTESNKDFPQPYINFVQGLVPQLDRSYAKDREPIHVLMAKTCLSPEAGFFQLILTLLTKSPLFVTAAAWRTGSSITDPNAVAYRSVLKGLIIALLELVPAELIPQLDLFIEVWVALFGRSEPRSIEGICAQFWRIDIEIGIARRAILDVARTRFPVHIRPLIRLLRAMTAAGFLDTDPLSTADHGSEGAPLTLEEEACANAVFEYLDELTTYTQVVPAAACTGGHALYEKMPERYTGGAISTGVTFTNLRPIKLPGGSTLPPKSVGRLLSPDGADMVVIAWQHKHSGWKVLLEILTDYVNRRRIYSGGSSYHDVSFGKRGDPKVQSLRLEDIGVEMDPAGDEDIVVDTLDLIRSVVQDNPILAERLLETLESGDSVVAHSTTETSPPDLVQLTTTILEEALSRSSPQNRQPPRTALITSAMSVLAALLPLPRYSNRVWLYIRSTASLFGSERNIGVTSTVLAAERLTGHYTMTLALLLLVQQLFAEASSSVLSVLQENPKMQQVKEEVLMRATRFIHSEIWIEHVGWKYAQLADRFEIGRRISSLYVKILRYSPTMLQNAPFAKLSQAVCDALLSRATMSAVHPIVNSITSGSSVMNHLYSTRRFGDARRLVYMLESHLRLTRIVLTYKQRLPTSTSSQVCLLEEVLCVRGTATSVTSNTTSKNDPIDALAAYVKERAMGAHIPVLAIQVLFALCSSLAACDGMPPTIVGHLSDPEGTVASLVRIVMHPYDDSKLRIAVWNFITLAVDNEPALANLFVTGHFRTPTLKGKEKAQEEPASKQNSALTLSVEMLEEWKGIWESNPQSLASVLRFLDVVWEHGHEHKGALQPVRQNKTFWDSLAAIVKEELGPVPDYRTENFVIIDGEQHTELHEAVSAHAYRTVIKSHALHIIGLDIRMALQAAGTKGTSSKPTSYSSLQDVFQSGEEFTDLIGDAASRTYDPSLHDELLELVQKHFKALQFEQLQRPRPLVEREFGDSFAFSVGLATIRLQTFSASKTQELDEALRKIYSVNLNISLAHAQTTLTQSWQFLLLQVVPFLRGVSTVRSTLLSIADSISADIASEKRSGDMMSTIHHARLSLLLSLLEVAWFSTTEKKEEIQHFIALVKNLRGILLNTAQSPAKSFLGQISVPFHRVVLQIAYFCMRHSRSLWSRQKTLNADQRLNITSTLECTLIFVIDALRLSFDTARTKLDLDLDQDLELLVAVFEESTRPDFNASPTFWLTRCQETVVIQASLELFRRMDLVGFSDLSLLRARKQPLYAPHVLTFHTALASVTSAAERLASEGVLSAYSENPISDAIKAGSIDVVLPELPGERSPAHKAYCSMLAVIAGVTTALGRHGQYFENEVSGLVQLYSDQIRRALSWTNSDPLTLPLLEEIEQVVNLFSAITRGSTILTRSEAVQRALSFFTNDALLLLQQVNYAVTHPNHLASLFEPITSEEKDEFESDSKSKSSVSSPTDVVDPMRRPFLARLVHRFFRLSSSILNTLIGISGAETVLTGEPEDWPSFTTLVVPHSKVVLGEPASIGTLLELGNCSLDVLRHLVNRPPLQAITPASATSKALDVRDSVTVARRNLEGVLFYVVTQLALWLSRPDFDAQPTDADIDDTMGISKIGYESTRNPEKERRAKRQSLTLAERLRRGMSGEMAADVQSLLMKAKPIIAKTEGVIEGKSVDLTPVLSRFVQERIMGA
ncbi:hypothetical protein K474DRAFT_1775910 [Panus rudis PR-1116 ss-1]|nr:hypothetical protein K474DRAFT_1775910 [Panus rudis PR-1116 ss-1]